MIELMRRVYHKYKKITAEKPPRYYYIDGFKLDMGVGHSLPFTQRDHLMYDRFVPYLGEIADALKIKDSWIIDIGANVGDTTAALIKHTDANILCVEPTIKFYELCKKNILGFGNLYADRVHLVQAYIAQNENEAYQSNIVKGTAIKVKAESNAEAPTYAISTLLKLQGVSLDKVALIKTDTDGYDSECMISIGEGLKEVSPVLFWENQIDNLEQKEKFILMANWLNQMGYTEFFIFDCFGNFQCKVDVNGLIDLNNYFGRIIAGKSTKHYQYNDILACKPEKLDICRFYINRYLENHSV